MSRLPTEPSTPSQSARTGQAGDLFHGLPRPAAWPALACTLAVLLSFPAFSPLAATELSAKEVVQLYGAAWNETDPAMRRQMLEKAWADNGIYADPTAVVEGRDALVQHIAGFQKTMRGAVLELTSAVDVHHQRHLRFSWKITAAASSPGEARGVIAAGMDYGELGVDGRLVRIVGFFGPMPPLDE